MQPYPRTWAEVDLGVLAANLAVIREIVGPETQIALVAKADAYGHGLVPVSRFAAQNGADWIAVATVQEGIALRDAGVDCPIIVLSPMLDVEADQGVFYRLDLMVENFEIAAAISRAAVSQKSEARVHLKVDTGLHRFGCTPADTVSLAKEFSTMPGIQLVGIAQHFVDSSQDQATTNHQIDSITALTAEVEKALGCRLIRHYSNSAGTAQFPSARGDLVRVGILAYGIDPFNLTAGRVQPVLAWRARITSIRNVPAGEGVSYGHTYVVTRDTRVATIGAGYGDGYPRRLSSRSFVTIEGHRANVIGLVCMDQLLVDVTDIPNVAVGDLADLIGPDVRAEELARLGETNSHEIVTRIMSRVPRRYRYPT